VSIRRRVVHRFATASVAFALASAGVVAGYGSGATRVAAATPGVPDAAITGCDVLMTAPAGHHCLLPPPNDALTLPAGPPTGRRLNIAKKIAPANDKGVHINTAWLNKGDGFSPGSEIITCVPGLSIAKSKIPTSPNIGASLATNAPIVVFDTATHTR